MRLKHLCCLGGGDGHGDGGQGSVLAGGLCSWDLGVFNVDSQIIFPGDLWDSFLCSPLS